jgi:RHS repeat-associated protein
MTSKIYGKNLGKETFLYDSFNLLEESDLEGNVTHYLYDGSGRKVWEEKCGRVKTYAYDSLGRLSLVSQEGLRTHFKRDLADRLNEETKTDATGKLLYKVSFEYDEDSHVNKITRYINGKEGYESFTYDSFGREIRHSDPLNNKTTTVYDENHVNELGQKVLQITKVDPLNISTVTTKDPYSRDVQERILNPQGITISCWEKFYDPQGNLVDWKDYLYENERLQDIQTAHFTYTSDHQIESNTRAFGTPKARTTGFTYTAGGKLETKTLPDGTVLSHTYTQLGFLETLRSSDGKIHHRFEYNKKGDLIQIVDKKENISIQREVDPFGNVTRELLPNRMDIQKSYDPFDRLQTIQIANMGHITYSYDPLYLRKVDRFSRDGKLQYTHQYSEYDLDSNLVTEELINGAGKVQHHIDLKGRKSEIISPYFSQKCAYNACDNLIKNTVDQKTISYSYDDLSQLTAENANTYAYDSLFNRRMKNDQTFQTNNLNELDELIYDLNGNQTQKDGIKYIYDPLNRLIEAASNTRKVCFQYDPLGRRLSKTVVNKGSSGWKEAYREHYLYDGKHEIGAIASDGTLKNLKVLAVLHKQIPSIEMLEKNIADDADQEENHLFTQSQNDLLIDLTIPTAVAVELNQKVYAPITDVQRNICRLVDPFAKQVVSRYDFSAFGEEKETPKDENPWRFAAKRFDPELNLIYFGKRYYDPESARWLTTDPAGFVDSLNLYQYDLNNPFRYYDPDGEFFFLIAIPFAQILCSAAVVSAVVDAVIVGTVAVAAWEGSKYVNNVIEKSNKGTKGSHNSNSRPSTSDMHDKAEKRRGREQRLAQERKQKIKNKAKNKKQQNKGK